MLKKLLVQSKSLSVLIIQTMNRFSSSNKIILSQVEQRAVIAYFALSFIIQFEADMYQLQGRFSIRERLINRQFFKAFIYSKVNKLFQKSSNHISNIQQIGLQEKNLDFVLKAFQTENGLMYDKIVYSQERFTKSYLEQQQSIVQSMTEIKKNVKQIMNDAAINKYNLDESPSAIIKEEEISDKQDFGKTVLHPLHHSSVIIRKLLLSQNRIIYGDKGIGKSFSYLLYSYLSSFIIEARIQQQDKNLRSYLLYVLLLRGGKMFYNVKKLFYLPIKSVNSYSQILRILKRQVTGQQEKKLITKQFKLDLLTQLQQNENFKNFHTEIIQKFHKKGVQLILIIDQANHFYGVARRHFLKLPIQNNNLLLLSKFLKYVQHNFQPYILNSSQAIQNYLLENQLAKYNYFNYFEHGNDSETDVKINYGDFVDTLNGTIELYGVMFFELEKQFIFQQLLRKHQLLIIRNYLSDIIKNIEESSDKAINSWKSHVRPLCLRKGINIINKKKYQFIHPLNSFLNAQLQGKMLLHLLAEAVKLQKADEAKHFIQIIKRQIQQISYNSNTKHLQFFLQNSVNDQDKEYRQYLLFGVRFRAYQLFNKSYHIFQINVKDILNVQNLDSIILTSRTKENFYLKQLLSQWPFARFDEKTFMLKILCSPQQFIKISNFITISSKPKFYDLLSRIYLKYRKDLTGYEFGVHLDSFASRLFRRGFCYLKCEESSAGKLNGQINNYHILNSFIFPSLNRTKYLNTSFKEIFDYVEHNNSNNYYCAVADNRTNEGFDFALCRKTQTNSEIQFITFDITSSQVQSKINKFACSRKINANIHEEKVMQIFSKVHLDITDPQFQNLIKTAKKCLTINKNIKQLTTFVKKISNKDEFPKIHVIFQNLANIHFNDSHQVDRVQKLYAELTKLLSMTYIFSLMKQYGISEQQKDQGLQNSQRVKKQLRQLEAMLVKQKQLQDSQIILDGKPKEKDYTLFQSASRRLISQAILIKEISDSCFPNTEQFIKFLNQVYIPQYTQYKSLIPQYLKEDKHFLKALEKHHFFTPFKHLRKFSRSCGLLWTHIIAVPEYQADEYKQFVQKNSKEFLFKNFSHIENGRRQNLQFKLASLKFDSQSISIYDKKETDHEKFLLLQEEYGFIKTIMKIMMQKKSKRVKKP